MFSRILGVVGVLLGIAWGYVLGVNLYAFSRMPYASLQQKGILVVVGLLAFYFVGTGILEWRRAGSVQPPRT